MQDVKDFKKGYCVASVMYIVFGAVLLVWPDLSLHTLCYVLGTMSIVFGIAHIVLYFIKDKMISMFQMDLLSGICGIAVGVFILVKPKLVIELLPFMAGVLMLLGAVMKLQNALDLKRLDFGKWYLILVSSLLMLFLGILLVVNPFKSMKVIVTLMGAGLLVDGLVNIFDMIMINYILKKMQKAMEKNTELVE